MFVNRSKTETVTNNYIIIRKREALQVQENGGFFCEALNKYYFLS